MIEEDISPGAVIMKDDVSSPGSARLLVFGYFGGRNFGDELMLLGLLREAETLGIQCVAIVTPDGRVPGHLRGRVERAFPKSGAGFAAGLRWASAFAICGGTMFHDGYPDERYRGYRKNLLSLAGLCVLMRLCGRRVLLLGVGLGPFHRRFTIAATRAALTAASTVAVRDRASFDDARMLGIGPDKLRLARDLAHSAKADMPSAAGAPGQVIVLSLVAPELTSTASHGEVRSFQQGLAERLRHALAERPGLRLVILVVGVGAQDNDQAVSLAFRDALGAGYSDRVEVRLFDGNPLTVAELLANARAVIATRYHVALTAELIGVPTFWVAYQRKVSDAASALSVPLERVIPPGPVAADRIGDWISTILQGRKRSGE